MQDKDFDQLFKDRFEGAEMEPSAHLWDNIAGEITPMARRRVLPVYWMAAAVAVIAVTIGLLMPKTETIKLHAAADEVAVVAPTVNLPKAVAASEATLSGDESTPLVIAPRLTEEGMKKDLVVMQPMERNTHLVNSDSEMAKQPVMTVEPEKVKPAEDVMIASVVVPDENGEVAAVAEPQAENKGIRNVGDLVNFVVNKVDKRDKKFIQFNTDDDDNSSLVAINIGILKFNKKDK